MIPYDDLVVALQTWRALKGLPVAQLSGALTLPPPAPVAAPPARAAAPPARPAAPPARPAAPVAPPAPARGRPAPAQIAPDTLDEMSLLDDSQLEDHLGAGVEDDGNFTMQFGGQPPAHEDESTAVGSLPPRGNADMDATNPHAGDPTLPRTNNRNDDW